MVVLRYASERARGLRVSRAGKIGAEREKEYSANTAVRYWCSEILARASVCCYSGIGVNGEAVHKKSAQVLRRRRLAHFSACTRQGQRRQSERQL